MAAVILSCVFSFALGEELLFRDVLLVGMVFLVVAGLAV